MSNVSLCVHMTFETSASNFGAWFSAQETTAFGKCAFELHFFFLPSTSATERGHFQAYCNI